MAVDPKPEKGKAMATGTVETVLCDIHLKLTDGQEKVAAAVPVPIIFAEFPNGKWTITFDPENENLPNTAWACRMCAKKILPGLESRKDWVKENIVDAAAYGEDWVDPDLYEEEEYEDPHLPGEDGGEDGDEEDQEDEESAGGDAEDLEAVKKHAGLSAALGDTGKPKPAGKKVTTPTPTAGAKKREPEIRSTPGFKPDMTSPDKEERQEMVAFHEKYGLGGRFKVPAMVGQPNKAFLEYWRSSEDYFTWMSTGVSVADQV